MSKYERNDDPSSRRKTLLLRALASGCKEVITNAHGNK
jgi:hypothetical protein